MKKRCFKTFTPDEYKEKVREMPELAAIGLTEQIEEATRLLTMGLTRILDQMAPLKMIQTKTNYAPHLSDGTKEMNRRRAAAQAQSVASRRTEDARVYRSLRNQALASSRADKARWEKEKLRSRQMSQ